MRVATALVLVLAFVGPAAADGCHWTTNPELWLDTPNGTYYVDNDDCQPDCISSVWVYKESNGIPGLQRQNDVVDPTCPIEPDTLVFSGHEVGP